MHQYERQAKFVEQIRTLTEMPRHTVREDDLWYIAKDLHKYLCQLDEGNLEAFDTNLISIIDLANMYAQHAGGLRTFPTLRLIIEEANKCQPSTTDSTSPASTESSSKPTS